MGEIAEIEDAADVVVVVEEQVVQREVGVHRLRTQTPPERSDVTFESVEGTTHQVRAIGDGVGHSVDLVPCLDVPQQPSLRGGVEEATQRQPEPRRRRPEFLDCGG